MAPHNIDRLGKLAEDMALKDPLLSLFSRLSGRFWPPNQKPSLLDHSEHLLRRCSGLGVHYGLEARGFDPYGQSAYNTGRF